MKIDVQNKKGLTTILSIIIDKKTIQEKLNKDRDNMRKSLVSTGDRSAKIRTYNFPQGRISDHRINLTLHRLEEFLEGEAFDEMIESLTLQAQEDSLSSLN